MKVVLNYLVDSFQAHIRHQDNVVERMKKRQREMRLCGVDGCKQIFGYCLKHVDQPTELVSCHPIEETPSECQVSLSGPTKHVIQDLDVPYKKLRWRDCIEEEEGISYEEYQAGELAFLEAEAAKTHAFVPHFGNELLDGFQMSVYRVCKYLRDDWLSFASSAEALSSTVLLSIARQFVASWDWVTIFPSRWIENRLFLQLAMGINKNRLRRRYLTQTSLLWSLVSIGSYKCARRYSKGKAFGAINVLLAMGMYLQQGMFQSIERHFRSELLKRNSTLSPTVRSLRDKHVSNFVKAGSIVGILYALAKAYKVWKQRLNDAELPEGREKARAQLAMWNAFGSVNENPDLAPLLEKGGYAPVVRRTDMSAHGSLEPTTFAEVEERDREANPWVSVVSRPLPVQDSARSTTATQLLGLICKNITYGSVTSRMDPQPMAVDGFFLRSNVVLIPQHYFKENSLDVVFRKDEPNATGGTFRAKICKSQAYFVPGEDIAMCYVPTGGSFKDLSKYLPTGPLSKVDFELTYRHKGGNLLRARGLADYCETGHSLKTFIGLKYRSLTCETFPGMCGAVLSSTHRPVILGYHLGGLAGTTQGCAGVLTLEQYEKGIQHLRNCEGVLLTGSSEHFEKNVMGVDILTNKQLHKKSPVGFQPHGSQINWYGTCVGHSTFKSRAKPTLMTEHVLDIMGAPNIYCKPIESPQWEPWQTCLSNMAIPGSSFEPEVLQVAIADYKSVLIPVYASHLWRDTCPLEDVENWNGVPGKKFLDRIKGNTAIGFPHTGKKENYLIEIEPFGEYTKVVKPVELVQDEIDRLLNCYKHGHRGFPIAKACKKDEILTKRKCRIFYSNPVAFTFLIRKYFLPLIRVLQFVPKLSECAVGINCHGPEWQQLHDFVYTFGETRLIGGDYGKYDQKIPTQLILAAIRILIDFSRECDYAEEDIRIMEAMAGDLAYAIIAYNGDLVGLSEGSHISGNSLTVIINGIVGSLNLRCYFYSFHPRSGEGYIPFRDAVKLMTYGDDNIGSVRKDIHNFTIKGASKFLEEHGQVYTMPDKESELLDFLPPEEFEFLKRKSVFHEALGVHVGALSDESCYKMLHFYVRDKKSPDSDEMACAKNIDTACREWFNHGEAIYEEKRRLLKEVASKTGILHLCENLDTSYGSLVVDWKEKYDKSNVSFTGPH
jgi:hypothetical protein